MSNSHLCTIVTVCFNDRDGLARTIESLRGLDSRFEHIVVDGGSTDGSPEWLRHNPGLHSTTLVSEPDSGIYDAMNKGLQLARGGAIIFINAGDQLLAVDSLPALVSRLLSGSDQWLVGIAEIVSPDGDSPPFLKPTKWRRYRWSWQTFVRYEICHPAMLVRTDVLRAMGGFDDSLRIAADFLISTSLGRTTAPILTDTVIARFERGGLSDISFQESLRECHRARVATVPWLRRLAWVDRIWTEVMLLVYRCLRRLE